MAAKQLPSQREILSRVAGVWEGNYLKLDVDGRLLECFASRQETRLVGDRWYERITYLRPARDPEVLDFRAGLDADGRLIFDDDQCSGSLDVVAAHVLFFQFRWKHQPGVEICETITLGLPDHKQRIWQCLEHGQLSGVTMVRERRLPDERPDEWF